ncbi:MAG: beta-phosphoglucomutase [Bacteroidales bacterium]|nr:beta-phosphoglucomutase [Bacteroidales bacterium]
MIKACIFDLDGVVVDTARYHYLAWKRLADGLGFDFTEVHNERLKGVSRMASLNIMLEVGGLTLPDDEKQKLAAQKNEWYLAYIQKMTPADILPGVNEFLRLTRSAGMKIALGTASKNAGTILARIGLSATFDAIIDGNRVTNAKPDPEVFLLAARDLKTDPENCVVFEDAIAGVEAAHNGGMKCIGVGQPDILFEADKVIPGFVGVTLDLIEF